MEALDLPASDDSDSTEVLEYDSDLADEDMHSATASVEDMDQDNYEKSEDDDTGEDAEEEGEDEDMLEESSLLGQAIDRATLVFDDDQDSDYVGSDSSLEYEDGAEKANPPRNLLDTALVSLPTVAVYQNVGFCDSEEEAEQALHRLNNFVYTYKTRYLSTFRVGKEYNCRSHNGCCHRIKLVSHNAGNLGKKYQVLQKGEHTGSIVNLTPKGISPVLKPEIDALLKLGMAAGRVRNMLLFKYLRDPAMLALMPETKKMENRKAYLKRKAGDGWEMTKFTTLQNWAAGRLCQSRDEFIGLDATNAAAMNTLIVLDKFEHLVTVAGETVPSMRIIVTSRAVFRNVAHAVRDQGDTLVLSTDGTYRIHFGSWTLVDCGGVSVERSGPDYVQRFRRWLYMFVRTESAFAYERMFQALVQYAEVFLDVQVRVCSASMDHSDVIASAVEAVWPHAVILTCWEHLLRQVRKQVKLEKTKGFLKDTGELQIRQLHLTRS